MKTNIPANSHGTPMTFSRMILPTVRCLLFDPPTTSESDDYSPGDTNLSPVPVQGHTRGVFHDCNATYSHWTTTTLMRSSLAFWSVGERSPLRTTFDGLWHRMSTSHR